MNAKWLRKIKGEFVFLMDIRTVLIALLALSTTAYWLFWIANFHMVNVLSKVLS